MIDEGGEWEQTRGESPMGLASRLPLLQCRNLCRSGAGQSRARGLADGGEQVAVNQRVQILRTVHEKCARRVRRVVDGEIVKFGGIEFEP